MFELQDRKATANSQTRPESKHKPLFTLVFANNQAVYAPQVVAIQHPARVFGRRENVPFLATTPILNRPNRTCGNPPALVPGIRPNNNWRAGFAHRFRTVWARAAPFWNHPAPASSNAGADAGDASRRFFADGELRSKAAGILPLADSAFGVRMNQWRRGIRTVHYSKSSGARRKCRRFTKCCCSTTITHRWIL